MPNIGESVIYHTPRGDVPALVAKSDPATPDLVAFILEPDALAVTPSGPHRPSAEYVRAATAGAGVGQWEVVVPE